MTKTRSTKPKTAKSAPKRSPKQKRSTPRPAPVAAIVPVPPVPAKPATRPRPSAGQSRIREDARLSLSTLDPGSVPGCRAMFRYGYDVMAKLKAPITLADLIARIDADAEYHRRSHQEVRGHVRQLVSRLRQWGLLVAVNPESRTKDEKVATTPSPATKADDHAGRTRKVG
jgi:hypothetical protein